MQFLHRGELSHLTSALGNAFLLFGVTGQSRRRSLPHFFHLCNAREAHIIGMSLQFTTALCCSMCTDHLSRLAAVLFTLCSQCFRVGAHLPPAGVPNQHHTGKGTMFTVWLREWPATYFQIFFLL